MDFIFNFFSTYWPLILILVLVVIVIAAIRAVRRILKEGGGAFQVSTAKKSSEPNKLWIKQVSKALVADCDMICETKGELIKPTKQDIVLLRKVIKSKYQVAMYLLPEGDKVVYFFCKSQAGLERRLKNLLPNDQRKSHRWPYADVETGKKLKYKQTV